MKLLNLIKRTLLSLHQSLKRFPVTLLLTTSVAITLIVLSETKTGAVPKVNDTIARVAMTLSLGIPLSLCIKFIFERYEKVKPLIRILSYLALAAFLIIYYTFFLKTFDMVPVTRYIALSLGFYLLALLIPYFYNRKNFELYTVRILIRFFITGLYSLVLQLGISAILFTIDKLLGVQVYDKLYLYVCYIIMGVFAPSYFLAGVPGRSEELYESQYPKVLKVLLLYIVMPLISVYTVILYIYFAKIVVTLQWPQGLVGNLVLWYSAITAIVIFLVWPLINENRWVRSFIFYITKLILPLIVIMFTSLGIRIKAYGITENRYFVIALGLWVLIIMLYWNFAGIKRNIMLPLVLSLIAILSVLGPWSAYSVSIASQNLRFESILERNNMLKNNEIVKPAAAVSEADKKEVSAILRYFESSHSLKDLKHLPKDFKLQDMKNVFGFEFTESRYNQGENNYFSYMLNDVKVPFDIGGYDYLFNFRYPGNLQSQSGGRLKAEYSYESHILVVYLEGTEIYKKDISDFAKKAYDKYGMTNTTDISPSDMTFTDQNDKLSIKFILFTVNGNKNTSSSDEVKINSIEFDMLVRIK